MTKTINPEAYECLYLTAICGLYPAITELMINYLINATIWLA